MRDLAELLVLDEPVRPDASTGLTAQIGLTGPETGLTGRVAGSGGTGQTGCSDRSDRPDRSDC